MRAVLSTTRFAVLCCIAVFLSVRGGKEFLALDLDTVFDVNSIVSEVLLYVSQTPSIHQRKCEPCDI